MMLAIWLMSSWITLIQKSLRKDLEVKTCTTQSFWSEYPVDANHKATKAVGGHSRRQNPLQLTLFFFFLIFIFLELISSFLVYFYFSSLAIDQLGQIICAIYRFLTTVY